MYHSNTSNKIKTATKMKLDRVANKDNFFTKSTACFINVAKNEIKGKTPDYVSYCKLYSYDELDLSKNPELNFIEKTADEIFVYENTKHISSRYWYTSEGVYRESDHWNRVASCYWEFKTVKGNSTSSCKTRVGFAKWTDFIFLTPYIDK